MLCCFVIVVFCMSFLILLLSVTKALRSSALDRDDIRHATLAARTAAAPARSSHHHRHVNKKLPTELRSLEYLKEHANEQAVLSSDWLPTSHRKRDSLNILNPYDDAATSRVALPGSRHVLDLRGHKRISDDTYYLGRHEHPREAGVLLHSYAFVHYAPSTRTESPVERSEKYRHFNRTAETAAFRHQHHADGRTYIECGAPIAMGARWKTSRGYYVHPHNSGGLDLHTVVTAVEAAADTWRCVFRSIHQEPMGPLLGVVEGDSSKMNFQRPSGDNHVAFAKLHMPDGGEDTTLAVTVAHGVYGGPQDGRYIAEFSTLFNDAYEFANCADPAARCAEKKAIDFQSIVTHELGHAHGLDDLYSSQCTGATMYWNAAPGELKKRSLTEDDRNSMIALYKA